MGNTKLIVKCFSVTRIVKMSTHITGQMTRLLILMIKSFIETKKAHFKMLIEN